mgnify:CR=1 FL=1
MTKWMLNASRAKPPAQANDFKDFVNAEYQTNIHERTAQVWLHLLGFKYRTSEALEIYNDGHERPNVKLATQQYCIEMMDIQDNYTGTKMDRAVPPVTNGREIVVSYHDECSAHSLEHCNRVWKIKGQGGQMKDKKRGTERQSRIKRKCTYGNSI